MDAVTVWARANDGASVSKRTIQNATTRGRRAGSMTTPSGNEAAPFLYNRARDVKGVCVGTGTTTPRSHDDSRSARAHRVDDHAPRCGGDRRLDRAPGPQCSVADLRRRAAGDRLRT